MVDSDKGITNLHVPSDVIIDASMPNVVRDGGQMWNKADKLEEVKCVIPDRSYATAYKTIIEDCQENGQFDWTTTGKLKLLLFQAKQGKIEVISSTSFILKFCPVWLDHQWSGSISWNNIDHSHYVIMSSIYRTRFKRWIDGSKG